MSRLDELLAIMAMLRDPEHGCPWDLQQNFQTIAPHTLEEVYEVVDTIDRQDYLHLKNELGDLLFQVVFYAQLGREQQLFGFDDIVSEIIDKLLQRHPHVFPDASMESFGRTSALTPGQVESNWEAIKSAERQQKSADSEADESEQASVMDDIPLAFPALTRARKIQKRAANLGFDWPDSTGVFAKLAEEIVELQQAVAGKRADDIADELGDLLFTIVNLSRHLHQEPESCLRQANQKFEKRFRMLEKLVADGGHSMVQLSDTELEQYWQKVKKQNR